MTPETIATLRQELKTLTTRINLLEKELREVKLELSIIKTDKHKYSAATFPLWTSTNSSKDTNFQ